MAFRFHAFLLLVLACRMKAVRDESRKDQLTLSDGQFIHTKQKNNTTGGVSDELGTETQRVYKLHAGLVRAHSFEHAEQLASAGFLATPLAPNVERPKSELFLDVNAINTLLATSKSHNDIYAGLLDSQIKKRGGTPGTFTENRLTQIAYVKSLYSGLLCISPEAAPQVHFVTGGTAVGKSSFVRTKANLPANTMHVNADDIRSLLSGNYEVYSAMTGDGQDASLMRFAATDFAAKDCNTVRFWVQGEVQKKKCNFLADSYSIPVFAAHGFYDAGYANRVYVYFLEIGFKGTKFEEQASDFEKKVELSRERIQNRISSGGHSSSHSDLMPAGFIKQLRMQMATVALNLKMPIQFYISQAGDYEQVEWPNVLDMNAKTSVDAA